MIEACTLDAHTQDNVKQASRYMLATERMRLLEQRNLCRPSIILGADLTSYIDTSGDLVWQASYGHLYASGDTPDAAFQAFDEAWTRGT